MDLISTLASKLNISQAQAEGGAGMLFKMAQQKLSSLEFQKLLSSVPEIGNLINKTPAPSSSGVLGGLGTMMAGFGGAAGSLGSLAGLAGSFSKLGMSSGMIGKFVPQILEFVENKGDPELKSILEKGLV